MVFDPRITTVLVGMGVAAPPPDEFPEGLPAGQPNMSALKPSRQAGLATVRIRRNKGEVKECVFIVIDWGVTSSTFSSLALDGKVKVPGQEPLSASVLACIAQRGEVAPRQNEFLNDIDRKSHTNTDAG